jgi:hypothetical protein
MVSATPARPALRDDPEAWIARSSDGETRILWRPEGGLVPRNRHFDLELLLERDGAPVAAAEVIVRATMPAHGHGMNVEPRALARPDGSYRVRGVLLHMAGSWELSVFASELGRSHRATFPLEVR